MSNPKEAVPSTAFERRFRAAALRVLRRHGVPEDRLDAEIARLRRVAPGFALPTVEELERAFAAGRCARARRSG